jgi:hypothetical protein
MTENERNPELNEAVRKKLREETIALIAKDIQEFKSTINRHCPDQSASQLLQNLAETALNSTRDRLLQALGKDEEEAA